MALPVFSTTFCDRHAESSDFAVFCPLDKVWIIRDVSSYLKGHSGDELRLVDLPIGGTFYLHHLSGALSEPHFQHEDYHHVIRPLGFEPIFGFEVQVGGGGEWDVHVSGYELTTVI